MSVEVGIVGLPNAGKTTLLRGLTRTAAAGSGKEHVAVAAIPDARLEQVAAVAGSRKVTPATIRIIDVPGAGAQLLGSLRRVDALVAVLDGWSGTRDPGDDLAALELELAVADRDHVERRLERVARQAKSGDPGVKAEAAALEGVLAHADAGEPLRTFPEPLPPELEPLTTKPLLALVNGPGGIDLALEAELTELPAEEAAEFREGPSALDEVVRRLSQALRLLSFFTAAEKEARAWTLREGQTALAAAETIHTDLARGFIRCEVVRWDDLVACGSHAEAARRGLVRLEGKGYVVADGDVLHVRFNV